MPRRQSEMPPAHQAASSRSNANESSDDDEEDQLDPEWHSSIDWAGMPSMAREVFWDRRTAGGLSIRHSVPFAVSRSAFLHGLLMLLLVTFARYLPLSRSSVTSAAGETDDDLAGNDTLVMAMLTMLALVVNACRNPDPASPDAMAPMAPRSPYASDPLYHAAQFGFDMGALSLVPHAWQAHNAWHERHVQQLVRRWFGEEMHRVETALAITEQVWPSAMLANLSQQTITALANTDMPAVPAEVLQSYCTILNDMAVADSVPEQQRSRQALLALQAHLLSHTPVQMVRTLDAPSTSQARAAPWQRPSIEEPANASNPARRVDSWFAWASASIAPLLGSLYQPFSGVDATLPTTDPAASEAFIPEPAQSSPAGPTGLVHLYRALYPLISCSYRALSQRSHGTRLAVGSGLTLAAVAATAWSYLGSGTSMRPEIEAFLSEPYDSETGMTVEDALIAELYFLLGDPTNATDDALIDKLEHILCGPEQPGTGTSTSAAIGALQRHPTAPPPSFNVSATTGHHRARRAASLVADLDERADESAEKERERPPDAADNDDYSEDETEQAAALQLLSERLRARIREITELTPRETIVEIWKALAIRIKGKGGDTTTDAHPAFEALRKNRSDSSPKWSNITAEVFIGLLKTKLPPSAMNANSDLTVGDLWLHEFSDRVAPGTGHAGTPFRSTPFTSVLRHGLPPGRDWNNTNLDGKIGVYSSKSPTSGNALPVTIVTLLETLRAVPAETQRRYNMALKERWTTDVTTSVDTEAVLLSKSVLDFARIQLALGITHPRTMHMLVNAAGAKVSEDGGYRAIPLEIGGYHAVDAVVLVHDDDAVVLVMPRFDSPIQEYADMHTMRKAIVKFASASRTRSRIEDSFRLSDRMEQGVLNLDGFLDLLGAAETDIESVIQNQARERTIVGNIFHWMAAQRQTEEFAEYRQFKDDVEHDNPHRHLENRQRTAYTVPPLQLTTPIRNAWHTQLSTAVDQLGIGQASGIPASAYSAPQSSAGIAGLGAEEATPLMQRRIMLGATRQLLHNAAPDIAAEATAAIRKILQNDFRRVEDPNDLCFSTYQPEFLPQFVDMHVKPLRNPEAFHLKSTISLVELGVHSPLMSTVIKAHTKPTSRGAPYLITSCNAIPAELLSPRQSLIPVKDFITQIRDKKKFDLNKEYQKKLTSFFKNYSPYLEKHAIQHAMLSADLMLQDGSLSQEDHGIAMKAFAQDANSLSSDITVRVLSLHRYKSIDCLHIESRNPPRVLLYMPGEAVEIRGFAARPLAITWLQSLHQDRENMARFVKAHFSLKDNETTLYYQGTFFSPGVEEFLKQAAIRPLSAKRDEIRQRLQLGRMQQYYLNGEAVSAPFSALNRIAKTAASDDAKLLIDSADDRLKQWWADAVGFVPIPFLDGVVKMLLAKTIEESKQGMESFGLDVLMTILPFREVFRFIPFNPLTAMSRSTVRLVGEKSVAVEGRAIAKFDSFFKPPVRINGKLGYLLSPNSAMSALRPNARYTVKIELEEERIAFEEGEYTELSDQTKLSWKTNYDELIKDAETSFYNRREELPDRGRTDVTLPPGKTTLAECIPTLFSDERYTGGALNKGVVIGEEHTSPVAREAVFDSLDALQAAGVKTIYTEWFLHEEHKAMLEAYYESGGELTKELAEQLIQIDNAAGISHIISYSMTNMLREARERGIRFVGIDTRTVSSGLPDDVLIPGHLWRDDRLTGMNYYAEQVVRKHQLTNDNAPWVLLAGYRHGARFPKGRTFTGEYIPGIGQLLDAMAIYVTEHADHEPVGYEGRILHQ